MDTADGVEWRIRLAEPADEVSEPPSRSRGPLCPHPENP